MNDHPSDNRIEIRKLRHRAERPLKIAALLLSLCVDGLLTYLSIRALKNPEKKSGRLF